jgi:hypothetical protein
MLEQTEHEATTAVPTAFATVEEAVEDIRAGKLVVVDAAADRETRAT